MVFNTVFKIFQLYRGGQFYWWRNSEDLEETTDLSQVTDKHNVVYLALIEKFTVTVFYILNKLCLIDFSIRKCCQKI
jgi:hypothetical protein